MKPWIRDLLLPVAVLLALPLGMLGPALTLPAVIYGFPVVMVAILAGLALLSLHTRRGASTQPVTRSEARPVPRPAPARPAAAPPAPGAQPAAAAAASSVLRVSSSPARALELFPASLAAPLAGGPFRRILVLIDPEDYAPVALARAGARARRDGADLLLASVMEFESAIRRGVERENSHHHPAAVRARLDKALENLCWKLEQQGLRVRRRAELDDPARRVPELARQEQADLVVVAPRQPRLLRRRARPPEWAGASPCPVLALSA